MPSLVERVPSSHRCVRRIKKSRFEKLIATLPTEWLQRFRPYNECDALSLSSQTSYNCKLVITRRLKMNGWFGPFLSFIVFVVIGGVFLGLHLLTRITGVPKGYAPGWQVRCTHCNKTKDAADVGMLRIGATSVDKRVFGRCSNCKGFRWLAIEHTAGLKSATNA